MQLVISQSFRKILLVGFWLGYFFILNTSTACLAPCLANNVYLNNRELIVEKLLEDGSLSNGRPYIIQGVTWSPATRAPREGVNISFEREIVSYGFFFDWPGRKPQGHEIFVSWLRKQHIKYYKRDITLMKEMGVNTVRVYSDFGDNKKDYIQILDEFQKNGIMVIMTVASSREEIDSRRYLKIVRFCKDHPSVLMWSIGNEWNLDYHKYWGYKTVDEAALATNFVAKQIKKIDPNHPVSSCLGDRFVDEDSKNRISWVLKVCSEVDVWGLNVYRGDSFGSLFQEWSTCSNKPFYFSEFGTDSFQTTSYRLVDGNKADSCKGKANEEIQAVVDIKLWEEIVPQLSALNSEGYCLGGLIHSFSDTLYKVGSYHLGLGGLIDYYSFLERESYMEYNSEGFYLSGGHPDDVANEEYFGLVDADLKPKKAYWLIGEFYSKLEKLKEAHFLLRKDDAIR